MKLKIDQIRTYDDAGFRRRAACLCFKSECESEILLVSSSRFHHLWIVPGGGVEPGEDPAMTAVREVQEEAGVVGKLGRLLDVFENKDRKTRTYVYVLVVEQLQEDYDDAKGIGRIRRWFSLEEANNMLLQHKPVQQLYLDKLLKDQDHQRSIMLCSHISNNLPCLGQSVHSHNSCNDPNFCSNCCSCVIRSNLNKRDDDSTQVIKSSHPRTETYREQTLKESPDAQTNNTLRSASNEPIAACGTHHTGSVQITETASAVVSS
ncbi:diphosphoinositol polyphosphate phosphohydrolase 1-like [Clavelina lepadiformis]|uniref:diphosphoinositol-polyphosphate diphosphatase n=1 Tax=Clavelina lepadiformis TaxID=159417 RepID=A0ABP0GEB1_CLALP